MCPPGFSPSPLEEETLTSSLNSPQTPSISKDKNSGIKGMKEVGWEGGEEGVSEFHSRRGSLRVQWAVSFLVPRKQGPGDTLLLPSLPLRETFLSDQEADMQNRGPLA